MARRKQKQPKKWKHVEIDQQGQENGPPAVTDGTPQKVPSLAVENVDESSSNSGPALNKAAKAVLAKKLKREAKRMQLEAARQRMQELRLAKKQKADEFKAE